MALEQAKKFLEELKTNDKVKELLEGKEKPANIEEAISLYSGVAKELGYDLNGEDLLAAIKEAAGQGAGEQELTPDEMENAGGGSGLMDWLMLNVSLPIIKGVEEIKKELGNLTPETVTNDLEQQTKDLVNKLTGF